MHTGIFVDAPLENDLRERLAVKMAQSLISGGRIRLEKAKVSVITPLITTGEQESKSRRKRGPSHNRRCLMCIRVQDVIASRNW